MTRLAPGVQRPAYTARRSRVPGPATDRSFRVLLVDSHPFVRRGVREMLHASMDDYEVVEASTGAEALLAVRARPASGPDAVHVVVLDVDLPDVSGIEVLSRLRGDRPRLSAVVLTAHEEAAYGPLLRKLGATAYVHKRDPEGVLLNALRRATSCETDTARPAAGRAAAAEHPELSGRELEILRQAALGHSSDEIGTNLCLSASTVRTYRQRVRDKLGLRTDIDLVRYAVANGHVL